MISRLKNSAGPTSDAASISTSTRGLPGSARSRCLWAFLDHHDGGVDHGTNGDGDAAKAHDVGPDAKRAHGGEGHQKAHRQHDDRDQR